MVKTVEKLNASGLAPVKVVVPRFTPAEPPALSKKRRAAQRALGKLVVPSDKKYTNWQYLKLAERFVDKPVAGLDPKLTIDQADYDTGFKSMAVPLAKAAKDWPEQVEQYLMSEALPPDTHYFSALSGATYKTGAVVVVPKGVKADIVAEFSAEAGKLNGYRTIIVVGEGAEATFTEISSMSSRGAAEGSVAEPDSSRSLRSGRNDKLGTIVSHGIEVYLAKGAKLDFFTLQQWPESVTNLSIYRGRLERDARLNWLIGSFGSRLSQLHIESLLAAEGAESNVRSVYYGSRNQHIDQQLVANHLAGRTTSNTYARGIVADQARAVYRGMIKIQKGAHGSSADQNGHAMLLGNTARVDSIPGLEIDADDVTAGHGATVGQVDEEKLFYLMARGISREAAIQLIIHGFFEDLFKHIKSDAIRKRFWAAVEKKQTSRLSEARSSRLRLEQ